MSNSSIEIISVNQLVPGMFVNKVTNQKGDLRVKSQGLVNKTSIIEALKEKGILELEVDYSRSNMEMIKQHQGELEVESPDQEEVPVPKKKKVPFGEALSASQKLHEQAKKAHDTFLEKIRSGDNADVESIKAVSEEIIDSIFHDADALTCVSLIKDSPDYILEHSVNCAIYMTIFAKHMGFDKELTEELCLAGFLMDTGMATIPNDLLEKKGKLTKDDRQLIEMHVDIGAELIEQSEDVSDNVLEIIRNHHERLDGSGYPEGKSGDHINIYARMAAIVDSYDALTNDRPYRKGLTPTGALKKLLSDSTGKYDQTLIHQFIRSIGVHPVGSLVKLKSGKLGIIVRSNKDEPLRPEVMTFYSLKSGHHTEIKKIDLRHTDDEIATSVRPEEFKINLTKFFREVFVPSIQNK
ncbi:MAG: DUF3391 domain-containing protein [Alteromonadaceae bacterium]|nr:DUF3391 domain-containing protein [Alteromonadaceae bacterium]